MTRIASANLSTINGPIDWSVSGLRQAVQAELRAAERQWANEPYGAQSRTDIDRLRALLAR